MAMAIGIFNVPDGIDGTSADDGQVWTANGAGNAAWENAAGGGMPYIGDVSDDGEPPTQATIEAAFVASNNRPSVIGDSAICTDSSGEISLALLVHADSGWTALIGNWITP